MRILAVIFVVLTLVPAAFATSGIHCVTDDGKTIVSGTASSAGNIVRGVEINSIPLEYGADFQPDSSVYIGGVMTFYVRDGDWNFPIISFEGFLERSRDPRRYHGIATIYGVQGTEEQFSDRREVMTCEILG